MVILKKSTAMASLAALSFYVTPASAELFINPTNKSGLGKVEVSGFYGTSTVEYEAKGGDKADVDRTFIGITGAYGISDKVDIYGSFANIIKAETEYVPDDDSGTGFAFGVRGVLPFSGDVSLSGYAQYFSVDEDYGKDRYGDSWSADGTELSVGVMASKQASNELSVYGGMELILTSDGDAGCDGRFCSRFDTERNDKIGFRLGAQYNTEGGVGINFSTAFAHETGFMLAVNKAF